MRVAGLLLLIRVAQSQKRVHQLSLGLLLLSEIFMLASSQSCPDKCVCFTSTVKCVNQNLTAVPGSLPANVKNLFLSGNKISRLTAHSFPVGLDQLTDLYLTGNKMEQVDSDAFANLPKLRLLDLSNNRLLKFSPEAFPANNNIQDLSLSNSLYNHSYIGEIASLFQSRTPQLTALNLSNNDLLYLPENTFSSLQHLVTLDLRNNSIMSLSNLAPRSLRARRLDLRDNSLTKLSSGVLAELDRRPGLQLLLAGNPWTCDCELEDTVLWLQRGAEQVADRQNLTCADPDWLRDAHLLQVNASELQCAGPQDMKSVLETSYVFLGMVLALIGVIFLLVLYLNRRGIKRWLYNIRDACRDHMEGYHYRYEVNSDPRLANLSLNSDV